MATKFYLHTTTTSDTGTLPGSTISVSASTPTQIASGTNRSMDATIGTAQASVALTTQAASTIQGSLIARFCSAPIAAQTIASQSITVQFGQSESNANSNFVPDFCLAVWRPSTGAKVGVVTDMQGGGAPGNTVEANVAVTNGSAVVTATTAQDGDILVVELWRSAFGVAQSMSTAYTNTVFYDGTTESSATTNAAYLLFANDVALSTGATQVPYLNPMPQLLAQ